MSSPVNDVLSYTFNDYNRLFEEYGGTDSNYLKKHFSRFYNTFRRVSSTWASAEEQVVVDVGAHWLHQSPLYSMAGCKVEALHVQERPG